MLSKSKRLNLKKDFSFVASGEKVETTHFKLFYRLGQNTTPLVNVALSKKNFKKAHLRNEAKRRAFSAVEVLYDQLLKNINLVIMPKAHVLDVDVRELSKELENVKNLYQNN